MKLRRQLMGQAIIILLVIIQLFSLLPLPVNAAPTNDTSIENRPFPADKVDNSKNDVAAGSTNLGWTLFKLILSLALIILMAYVIIRVFGKQVNRRFRGRWLQVIDELIVGPNRGVVLCEVGGRILALGVTDHSINVLFEVNDEDLIKEMLAAGPEAPEEWSQLSAMKNLIDQLKGRRFDRFDSTLDQWLDKGSVNPKERGHRQ